MTRVSIFDTPGLEQLQRDLRIDPHCVRKLRTSMFKHFKSDEFALAEFPISEQLALHPLTLDSRHDSQVDGASKLLFRTATGMLIESVILRITTGRTTLCVSSQVGCAAACEFCATGKMGIARDLTAEEICDQVLQAGQLLAKEGRTLRNIVFMGMGEPFHNEEQLYAALDILTAPQTFHFSPTKILVSTVGVPEAMLRCVRRFPQVNLALSLHSVSQETREQLIPLAKRFPLDQLQSTLRQANSLQRKPVMIEYLMLAGVNDSVVAAQELVDWLAGLNVHVNLIPYNSIEDAPHLTGTDRPGRDAFASLLKQAGVPTTIRYSLGADIAAACGQLVRKENRAQALAQSS
ncbi:23S rRNA (adenine(2503)-C(2))-methyltransferase RlmN [Bythopirellula polymerisocia]|uniref:Ribosomal RNA large subunit methyltransferase Cfr n=1 Tax=Bythopirellula polymerisocia TaxID=2528003 RepID=A0A5C6D586_9BACT|nr:23S rRNA (adenine(2503)-C(2))-methyltransferase RlmN [Bythopirellula polymerisocia]TWU30386.1 Ribosomal RNA large subunit methyltransferase Cfr [Bythopirellula polymerisocia]